MLPDPNLYAKEKLLLDKKKLGKFGSGTTELGYYGTTTNTYILNGHHVDAGSNYITYTGGY